MQDSRNAKLLIMTAGGQNPQVMINVLAGHFANLHILQEDYEPKGALLRRRARRFGWVTAFGQLATMMVSRLGKGVSARRASDILRAYGLSGEPDPTLPVTRVSSLNDAEAKAAIAAIAPDLVFTISCRLLSRKTLAAIPCPVVNFHAGINPTYRGQMGGYWARVEKDEENFGATLHLVDAGTDTGETLAEIRVKPAQQDNLSTYPLLLTAASAQQTVDVLDRVLKGNAEPIMARGPSVLRFPPPLWTYLFVGLSRGIW